MKEYRTYLTDVARNIFLTPLLPKIANTRRRPHGRSGPSIDLTLSRRDKDISAGLLPDVTDVRQKSTQLAAAVIKQAVQDGLAQRQVPRGILDLGK